MQPASSDAPLLGDVVEPDGGPLPGSAREGGGAIGECRQPATLADQDVLAVHAKGGAGEVSPVPEVGEDFGEAVIGASNAVVARDTPGDV